MDQNQRAMLIDELQQLQQKNGQLQTKLKDSSEMIDSILAINQSYQAQIHQTKFAKGQIRLLVKLLQDQQLQPDQIPKINQIKKKTLITLKNSKISKYYSFIQYYLPNHQYLNLLKRQIGICEIRQLVLYDWSKIKVLGLGNNNIGDYGLKIIMSAYWPHLTRLFIYGNNLTEIEALIQLNLFNFEEISLMKGEEKFPNRLDKKAAAFIKNQSWDWLQVLTVGFIQHQSEKSWALLSLLQFKQYSKLTNLNVFGCEFLSQKVKKNISEWTKNGTNRSIYWLNENGRSVGFQSSYNN